MLIWLLRRLGPDTLGSFILWAFHQVWVCTLDYDFGHTELFCMVKIWESGVGGESSQRCWALKGLKGNELSWLRERSLSEFAFPWKQTQSHRLESKCSVGDCSPGNTGRQHWKAGQGMECGQHRMRAQAECQRGQMEIHSTGKLGEAEQNTHGRVLSLNGGGSRVFTYQLPAVTHWGLAFSVCFAGSPSK